MNRIDHHPGRGSGNSCRARTTPVKVTAEAAANQMTIPTARTHGIEPVASTMTPTMPTARPD
jgi:hypothetical protein